MYECLTQLPIFLRSPFTKLDSLEKSLGNGAHYAKLNGYNSTLAKKVAAISSENSK